MRPAAGSLDALLTDAAALSFGPLAAMAVGIAVALAGAVALWLILGSRRRAHDPVYGEWDAAHLLSAIPDGLIVLQDGRVRSVNRRLCDLAGLERDELLGVSAPLPFWPPEHRHEIEAWHGELDARGEHDGELTFRHRDGSRVRVLVAGRTIADDTGKRRQLVTVRDVSARHRRERRLAELASRDAETGLLNRVEFEERLGAAVRRAIATQTNVAVVLAELTISGGAGQGVFHRPEVLVAVERLRALLRTGDEVARTRESELAWILPETDAHGGVGTVARVRTELADLDGVSLTVGICDLATAGEAFALYAFADRALAAARRQGPGGTAQYTPSTARPAPEGAVLRVVPRQA